MKAAFIEQFGGPEVLQYGNLPDPVVAPSEVVIDVVAASINGADWKVRVGQYKQSKFPFALGRDFSTPAPPPAAPSTAALTESLHSRRERALWRPPRR